MCPKPDWAFPCPHPLKHFFSGIPHFSGQHVRPAAALIRHQSLDFSFSCPLEPGQSPEPMHFTSQIHSPCTFLISSFHCLSPSLLLWQHPNRFPASSPICLNLLSMPHAVAGEHFTMQTSSYHTLSRSPSMTSYSHEEKVYITEHQC